MPARLEKTRYGSSHETNATSTAYTEWYARALQNLLDSNPVFKNKNI